MAPGTGSQCTVWGACETATVRERRFLIAASIANNPVLNRVPVPGSGKDRRLACSPADSARRERFHSAFRIPVLSLGTFCKVLRNTTHFPDVIAGRLPVTTLPALSIRGRSPWRNNTVSLSRQARNANHPCNSSPFFARHKVRSLRRLCRCPPEFANKVRTVSWRFPNAPYEGLLEVLEWAYPVDFLGCRNLQPL